MDFFKIGPKDDTEEDREWRMRVKIHKVLSSAFRLMLEEYPEKFHGPVGGKVNTSIRGDTITITGDVDVWEPEIHNRVIDYLGEKGSYRIILRKD